MIDANAEFQSILNASAFLDPFAFPSDDSSPILPFLELGFICSHVMIICIPIICPISGFFNGLEICYDFALILDSSFM